MRFIAALALAPLLVPATVHAGVIAREGSELVYRSDPGEADQLLAVEREGVLDAKSLSRQELRLGPGCAERPLGSECPLAGVTGVRIIAGDGADRIEVFGPVPPLTADLGDGDDSFSVSETQATVIGGPGNDSGDVAADAATVILGEGDDVAELEGFDNSTGPYLADGGPGNDLISLRHRGPAMTLSGGDGDDRLYATAQGLAPVSILCGPGADRWIAAPRDAPGDGCAAHLSGITPRTVSTAFREGALTGPAFGSVTLKRRFGLSGRAGGRVARGTFSAGPGPLRVDLKRTPAGRRWLRRTPRLTVFVTIVTRTGADRGEVQFAAHARK